VTRIRAESTFCLIRGVGVIRVQGRDPRISQRTQILEFKSAKSASSADRLAFRVSQEMEKGERRDRNKSTRKACGRGVPCGSPAICFRLTPFFEGAQPPSKMLTVFESEHLGKPRRFLRRCAAFSKVRT
jgi:hypothetical protein